MNAVLAKRTSNNSDMLVNQVYDYYNGGNGKNNGRIQKITDNLDSTFTSTYTYDDYQRLTGITASAYTRGYSYDNWGNMTNLTATGPSESGGFGMTYSPNASGAPATNRLWQYAGVTALNYDAVGNQIYDGWQSHTYDAANRLKTALNNSSSYEYDGEGHRIKQTNSAGTIYYLWSSVLGQVTAEIAGSSVYRAYVYSAGGQMLALQSYYGDFYWVHQDHLGSSRKMTDMSGNVVYRGEFDPYGQTVFEWSNYGTGELYKNSRKYTGYERDWATNLDNANARTLNHKAGRFLQADPLGLGAASASDPQSLNRYSYVGNDPVNFTDPSGLNRMYTYLECDRSTVDLNGAIEIHCTLHVVIFEDDIGGGSGGGQVGGILGGIVNYPQIEPNEDATRDKRAAALTLARIALIRSSACRNAIAGSHPDGGDPLGLLNLLAGNGQFNEGPDPGFTPRQDGPYVNITPAFTQGRGRDARIVMNPGVGGFSSYYQSATGLIAPYDGLNPTQMRALGILHELSHATGRYVHPENSDADKARHDEVIGNRALTNTVKTACFG